MASIVLIMHSDFAITLKERSVDDRPVYSFTYSVNLVVGPSIVG